MIESRNEYSNHLQSHQSDINMNFRSRQSVFQGFLKKDVQVYHDNSQQSQMLEQMKIPINDECIQIPDWLDNIYTEYGIPLKQAQYINIWDPVESRYIDITRTRSINCHNFKQAQPIYLRYLPNQEHAVPPHANYQSMIDENISYNYHTENPLYQNNQQNNLFNNSLQQTYSIQNTDNWQNIQQQGVSSQLQANHSYGNFNNAKSSSKTFSSQSYQRTNSDVASNTSTTTTSNSSIRPKRQSMVTESSNGKINLTNNAFLISSVHNTVAKNEKMAHLESSHNPRRLIDQLKQEANSSSPIEQDENVLKNLKMEDQGSSFASTINIGAGIGYGSKSILLNLKKEYIHESSDNMQASGELNGIQSGLGNNSTCSNKQSSGKTKHKDSDQLSQKDVCSTPQQNEQQTKNHKHIPREKRVKERQISYVKGKVDEWRNLYDNGFTNSRGEIEKVNLDVAAQIVGLSRKTLDDYYAQLRKAQKYGFDFDTNSSEKMGTLRKYVKKMSEKDVNAGDDESQDTDNNTSSKSNFNTPQLKPSIPSDIIKQELSMSVGHPSNALKFSENNLDLPRQTSIPLKHAISTPSQQQQSQLLFNQVKIEPTSYSQNIISVQAFNSMQQEKDISKPNQFAIQNYNQNQSFKIENSSYEEKAADNSMNLEDIDNNLNNNSNNNNMCNNEEPMEQEDDDNFTDYINSENNPKEEQNDD
ncbi:hypothetical protein ABPG72_014947 [Tetrahymena utriculariae]